MKDSTAQPEEHEVPVLKNKGPQCPELESVQQIMDLYIDGVRNGNVASLQQAFHPQSSMFGWKGKDLYITPIQGLFDYIGSSPIPSETGEPTTFIITSIQVNGNAANVEMAMDSYHGHDFMDYFQLLKVEDRWWIVSKTFHANPHERY
jgi:hypothetical protein